MDHQPTDHPFTGHQYTDHQFMDRQPMATEWSVPVDEFIWDIQAPASESISVGNSDLVLKDLVLKDLVLKDQR